MIKEAYISFDVAQLLKEKGFNECSSGSYNKKGEFQEGWGRWNTTPIYYAAPTQQMAIRWLREEHKMYVCIGIKCFMPHLGKIDGYSSCIWYKPDNNEGICCYWVYPPKQQEAWDTYETATEAAIKYCLENLVKDN